MKLSTEENTSADDKKTSKKKSSNEDVSRSWFVVINNPIKHGYIGTENEICQKVLESWTSDDPYNVGAVLYCISENGLEHLHCVFENTAKPKRFASVKRLFGSAHIEATKGTKAQVEEYIEKRGKFEEKGEIIVAQARKGKLVGASRKDNQLRQIEEMIEQGMRPEQIMSVGIFFRQHENLIRKAYFAKRFKETPPEREVRFYWHVGESGSGKSYTYVKLCEKYGEDSVYMYSDCDNGALDRYQAEPILFIDEFKGQMSYERLLRITDKYKTPLHARYSDVYALWNEIHLTSVYPPECAYQGMVNKSIQEIDTMQQLMRRLTAVIYHYKEEGEFKTFEMSGSDYVSYSDIKQKCQHNISEKEEQFIQLSEEEAEQLEIIFT